MKILFFDTEINNFKQNRIIQLAWQVIESETMQVFVRRCHLIKPDGWVIPQEDFWINNGFSTRKNYAEGLPMAEVLEHFLLHYGKCDLIVSHNFSFDQRILTGECSRAGVFVPLKPTICTMSLSKDYCRIPLKGKNGIKAPRLEELYGFLFNEPMQNAHDAGADVEACKRSFFELIARGIIKLPVAA